MTRPTTPNTPLRDDARTTPAQTVVGASTDAEHDAVEQMLKAILDEVPHPDLWAAIHAVQGRRAGGDTRPDRMSPRYSAVAKRRSRSTKR